MDRQLQVDLETLEAVVPALERLEADWNDARGLVAARTRGYFTPDEEDRVRQMLLAYRNYRLALHEIIHRGYEYPDIKEPERQLMVFLLAFAAALTVYAKSLRLIEAYEREPLVRKKLNEPDAKFELEADFFEDLLRSYSSPANYRGLAQAVLFWRGHRRLWQQLPASSQPDWKWVLEIIRKQRGIVRKRLLHVLSCRLRYDWRTFARTVIQPVHNTRYNIRAQIAGACSQLRTTRHYEPALTPDVLARLRPHLCIGDVLLIRAEKKITSAILPGFWAHAALFIDTMAGLESLGIAAEPAVAKQRERFLKEDAGLGCVIEAITPRVRICPLQSVLFADHVVVFRPRINAGDLKAAVVEAFHHVDKPYDYEFDFNVSTRIVCTELIYRCFHKRGPIEFKLIKRLGRYTLSGDDMMNQWLESADFPAPSSPTGFDLVALVLKMHHGRAEFFEGTQALESLNRIQKGWRPVDNSQRN